VHPLSPTSHRRASLQHRGLLSAPAAPRPAPPTSCRTRPLSPGARLPAEASAAARASSPDVPQHRGPLLLPPAVRALSRLVPGPAEASSAARASSPDVPQHRAPLLLSPAAPPRCQGLARRVPIGSHKPGRVRVWWHFVPGGGYGAGWWGRGEGSGAGMGVPNPAPNPAGAIRIHARGLHLKNVHLPTLGGFDEGLWQSTISN
jgi:hypothetical protein